MVPCCANYRHLQFDSGDLCKGQQGLLNRHEPVSIGNGAIIFELSKPRIAFHPLQDKAKLCEVHIKAPDGFGILAYVQEAYLRRNSSDMACKDYIQFGQYDKLPFFTMEKSTPICGHVDGNRNFSKGFMYDDPHGHLLIWINLSGRQKTSHWPAIYTVNISLVLTAYQANCGTKKTSRSILKNVQPPKRGFNSCGVDPGPCISKDYFCDKRFNCVGKTETERTHDELQCQYKAPASSSKSENGDVKKDTSIKNINNDRGGGGASQKDFDSVLVDPNALNTISWVLIGICTFLGILLILILAIGCTRNTFCRQQHMSLDAAECFQHERNLADLSSNRLETEPNVYLPLDTFRQNQVGSVEEALVPQTVPDQPPSDSNPGGAPGGGNGEEPPPSYDSLFPINDAADDLNRGQSLVNE